MEAGTGAAISAAVGQLSSNFQADRSYNFQRQQEANQRFQADTVYTRAVADMKNAGLNPMLAYGKGAQAPTGSPVGSPAQGHIGENPVTAGMNSAVAAAQIEKLKAEAENVRADTVVKTAQAPWWNTSTAVQSEEIGRVVATREHLAAQIRNLNEEYFNIRAETERKQFYNTHIQPAEASLRNAEEELARLQLPKARNLAGAQKSWWMQNIHPYVDDATRIANSGSAFGILNQLTKRREPGQGITINNQFPKPAPRAPRKTK